MPIHCSELESITHLRTLRFLHTKFEFIGVAACWDVHVLLKIDPRRIDQRDQVDSFTSSSEAAQIKTLLCITINHHHAPLAVGGARPYLVLAAVVLNPPASLLLIRVWCFGWQTPSTGALVGRSGSGHSRLTPHADHLGTNGNQAQQCDSKAMHAVLRVGKASVAVGD